MISDKTIDEKTAKYWCAFADKEFKGALDKVLSTISSEKTLKIALKLTLHNISLEDNSNKDLLLNEGLLDALAKYLPTDPTGGSLGIVGDNWGKSEEEIRSNAAAMATAAGIAATALTPAGRGAAGKVVKGAAKHPLATGITVAAGKLAIDAAGEKDDPWLIKLEKLVNKVWDIGKFTAVHSTEIAVASIVAYALFKTASIWMPLVASSVKALLRGSSLATVDFDSNGIWYRMRYDMKYKRWELVYKEMSFGSHPSAEETEQLMKTKFFKTFLSQCKKHIMPIVENDERSAVLQAIGALSDKKTKKTLNMLLSDKDAIDNMLALKFKY